MTRKLNRREFVTSAAVGFAAAAPASAFGLAPAVITQRRVSPVVVASANGHRYTNGGTQTCVETAFDMMTSGTDVLDALIAGVNIVELDPEDASVGYGGRPNADGIVQLDACCMHGPKRRAGGVAALEGVRTPSKVAQMVGDVTDHHLLVGEGAQRLALNLGFTVEDDLNTDRSRRLWLEWKRRTDPDHYLDPDRSAPSAAERVREAGLDMLAEGTITEEELYGTINCDGIDAGSNISGVTTTSGLAWKIPGRVGDSSILGAGLYVDNEIGAAGSTGRGEANLYNLTSFLIVEQLRGSLHPVDAGMEALRRIQANTVDSRLLNRRGLPRFGISFYILDKQGRHAGVSMYAGETSRYAVCTENGAELRPLEPLLDGAPRD